MKRPKQDQQHIKRKLAASSKQNESISDKHIIEQEFQVLIMQKIGTVAYKLNLPTEALIDHVFHVYCLKKKLGKHVTHIPTLPPVDGNGEIKPKPEAIVDRIMNKWVTKPLKEN